MSIVELKRLFSEWRIRLKRVQEVVQPPVWNVNDWNHFARALFSIIRKYGNTWTHEETTYWDIRWDLENSAQLICQVEENTAGKRSLVVAQQGGFAQGSDNYTWFYSEFNEEGTFIGDPYWVDGNWKDALAMMLLPQQMAAGFYLQGTGTEGWKQNLLTQSNEIQKEWSSNQEQAA
ncbi:MAG: hypothetical protein AAF984_05590 [Verrucomicrobiota bacterium]